MHLLISRWLEDVVGLETHVKGAIRIHTITSWRNLLANLLLLMRRNHSLTSAHLCPRSLHIDLWKWRKGSCKVIIVNHGAIFIDIAVRALPDAEIGKVIHWFELWCIFSPLFDWLLKGLHIHSRGESASVRLTCRSWKKLVMLSDGSIVC